MCETSCTYLLVDNDVTVYGNKVEALFFTVAKEIITLSVHNCLVVQRISRRFLNKSIGTEPPQWGIGPRTFMC